jgi:hypothetical protein
MRVVQLFTEQDVMSLHRTLLDTMESGTTDKATTSTKEEVSVVRRETGEGVKGEAVHSNRDRIGEHRTLVESEPMGIVVIGHWRLHYPETSSINTFLYTLESVKEVSLPAHGQTKDRTNGVEGTNVGLMKTIGDDTGCPGIGSSQIPTI